jgi:hypothetical protein
VTLAIDPCRVTRFDRTPAQFEAFVLFAYFVAGYRSDTVAPRLNGFLAANVRDGETPFQVVARLAAAETLAAQLAAFGLNGQITRRMIGLPQLAALDVRDFATADAAALIVRLESVHGMGPKSARFVLLHSRPDVRCAVLDRHILRFLERQGEKIRDTSRTPTSPRRYAQLEAAFLAAAHERRMTPAALDLALWTEAAGADDGQAAA